MGKSKRVAAFSKWKHGITVLALGLLAVGSSVGSTFATENSWPSRPVSVIVGFGAGGVTDIMARTVSKKLSEDLGQGFIVENRVGAGGNLAATYVARSVPDGYTLFFAAAPQMLAAPKLQSVTFDPMADFVAVSPFGSGPFVLVIRPTIPAKTVPEFVSYAKNNKLTYGSPGIGSITHLLSALFLSRAGIEATHVPFRGGDQAMVALLGGQIDVYFSPLANVLTYADTPQVTLLAVASERRVKQLPGVPTVGEFYPNTVLPSWNGFFVPAKTPKAIVDKLAKYILAATQDPVSVEMLTKLGVEPGGETPEKFAVQILKDQSLFDAAIKAADVKRE